MYQKKILTRTLKELDGIEYFPYQAATSGKTVTNLSQKTFLLLL